VIGTSVHGLSPAAVANAGRTARDKRDLWRVAVDKPFLIAMTRTLGHEFETSPSAL
jgi:hypothetical protein